MHASLRAGQWSSIEFAAQMRETLSTPIIPPTWDSADEEIGCTWWVVHRPDGAVITGFVGIGLIVLEPHTLAWRVGWTVACPDAPGASERRAWLQAAIAALAGPGAIIVDGAHVVRERGVA